MPRLRKVLVIDDSPTIRRAIAIELRPLGVEVEEAASAAEGIARARASSPNLITLDLHLPGASGYDVCEELSLYDETIGIPIVMVSSQSSDRERLRAIAAGAHEYFVKPFRPGELRSCLVKLFEGLGRNLDKIVYVLDASRSVRGMLERVLTARGYECLTFERAADLFDAIKKRPCDILLLDLGLPNFAAFELLADLRKQPIFDAMPILVLSASGSRKDLTTAFRAGANEVVRKPFFCEELLVRIECQLNVRELTQQLHEDAVLDPLTKLYNRRQLEHLARTELHDAIRDHKPLGALIVDIDHFKAFNDNHGHSVGDLVLRAVAQTVQQASRRADVVARYGGEEFVVLVPRVDEAGLVGIAETLRAAVGALQVETPSGPLRVTISVGGAAWNSNALSPTFTLAAVLKPADDALYESKRNGRNRSTVVACSASVAVVRLNADPPPFAKAG